MSTSIASGHGSLLSTIARWWRNWIGDRSRKFELQNLGSEDLNCVARDAGVSPQVLLALAGKWPEATELLSRRMWPCSNWMSMKLRTLIRRFRTI